MSNLSALQSWSTYLLTDPKIVGSIAWVGLSVTIAGFWIALVQISRIKTASEAARGAVIGAVGLVRSQEQSGRLSAAISRLASTQTMMRANNIEAAAAHLEVAWSTLIEARELTDDASDRGRLELHVVALRRVFDNLDSPERKVPITQRQMRDWYRAISTSSNDLGIMSARSRMRLSGIGGKQ